MGWFKDTSEKLKQIVVNQESIIESLSQLEDKVAWISATVGGQGALSRSSISGVGSSISEFLHFFRGNGDEYVCVWDSEYNTGSGTATMDIYKNGSLVDTETVATWSGAFGSFMVQPVVYLPAADRLWWIHTYSSSSDPKTALYEYDFDTQSSSLKETIDGITTGNADPMWGSGIGFDPTSGKMYIFLFDSNEVSGNPHRCRIQLFEYSSDGTIDHEIIDTEISAGTNRRANGWAVHAYDGTVYFSYVYSEGSAYYSRCGKISASLVSQTSWTVYDGYTASGSVGYADTPTALLPFGLCIRYNESTIRSPDESTTWDCSSYLDVDHGAQVVQKIDSGENYLVLTRTGTTVYLLKLESDTSVTSLGSVSVDSDYDHLSWVSCLGENYGVGVFPRSVPIGSGKKFLQFVPLTRDVI